MANSTFVLYLTNFEDVRDIIQLHGSYRVDGEDLYFTIMSKTIVKGKIDLAEPGVDLNIFTIYPDTTIEVPEVDATELSYPCYITYISSNHVKLNNEDYYRVETGPTSTQ